MSKTTTDHVIIDADTGDLLDGPMSHEHARYLVDRNYNEAERAARDGLPRGQAWAMCTRGELRGVQERYARQMSGNPPRDLRARTGGLG